MYITKKKGIYSIYTNKRILIGKCGHIDEIRKIVEDYENSLLNKKCMFSFYLYKFLERAKSI